MLLWSSLTLKPCAQEIFTWYHISDSSISRTASERWLHCGGWCTTKKWQEIGDQHRRHLTNYCRAKNFATFSNADRHKSNRQAPTLDLSGNLQIWPNSKNGGESGPPLLFHPVTMKFRQNLNKRSKINEPAAPDSMHSAKVGLWKQCFWGRGTFFPKTLTNEQGILSRANESSRRIFTNFPFVVTKPQVLSSDWWGKGMEDRCDITNDQLGVLDETDPKGRNLTVLVYHLVVVVVSTAGDVAPYSSPTRGGGCWPQQPF